MRRLTISSSSKADVGLISTHRRVAMVEAFLHARQQSRRPRSRPILRGQPRPMGETVECRPMTSCAPRGAVLQRIGADRFDCETRLSR